MASRELFVHLICWKKVNVLVCLCNDINDMYVYSSHLITSHHVDVRKTGLHWKLCSSWARGEHWYASMRDCEFIACIQITHKRQCIFSTHMLTAEKSGWRRIHQIVGSMQRKCSISVLLFFVQHSILCVTFSLSLSLCLHGTRDRSFSINSISSFIMHTTHMCSLAIPAYEKR